MSADPRTQFANHYAFLVGIDEYKHFPGLQGADSDATTLRDALRWVGYPEGNLQLVPSVRTSLIDLHDEINDFLEKAKGSRRSGYNPDIVVFWAGHGVPGDDGGFLIARDTKNEPADWPGCAISLDRIVEKFRSIDPASLTIFFDVCHSVPSHRVDLKQYPRELILAPMRDSVLRDSVRTTFVGVSTLAYEVWDIAHDRKGMCAGILADAIQRVVRGERCDDNDGERCHGDDFAVTDKRIVSKLEEAVRRKAGEVRIDEQLYVLADGGRSPRKIGFAVRSHADTRLDELRLSPEADFLARIVVENSGPRIDFPTDFGRKMVRIFSELIYQRAPRDVFLRDKKSLVCTAILELRTDRHLDPYVYFLLHCCEEAKRDDGAKKVLEELYKHLLSGGSSESLGHWLNGPYRAFSVRHALPWSCGIPVRDDDGKRRYAPIIYHGVPVIIGHDAQRTFVTTSPLQREALLDVWRTDASNSTLSGWPRNGLCYQATGKFSKVMPKGQRVWVRIGLDAQGCEERCMDVYPGVSVPMKIMLGMEGSSDCDWRGHWHLDLGARWPKLRGPWSSGSEPSWAAGLVRLIDECVRSLEALLTGSEGSQDEGWEDEATILIDWLYRADVMMRMLDESRLENVVLALIAAWKDQASRNVLRLSRALQQAIDAEPDTEENGTSNQGEGTPYWEVGEAILERHGRWLSEQPAEHSEPDTVDRAELLVRLLRAVMAEESAETHVVAFVTQVAALSAAFDQVVMAGASPAPERVMQVVVGLARTAEHLLREESAELSPAQLMMLRRWAQLADQTPDSDSFANLLNESSNQESIGVVAWLLVRNFMHSSDEYRNLSYDSRNEFDALVGRLRLSGDGQEKREAAERMYWWLKKRQNARPSKVVSEEEAGVLMVFVGLLWPASRITALKILATDTDWSTAFKAIDEFANPDRSRLMGAFRGDDDNRIIFRLALLDSLMGGLPDFGQFAQSDPTADPVPQAIPRTYLPADEYYEQTLLAVPPEERHGS